MAPALEQHGAFTASACTPYPAGPRLAHRADRTQYLRRVPSTSPLANVTKVWGNGAPGVQNKAAVPQAGGCVTAEVQQASAQLESQLKGRSNWERRNRDWIGLDWIGEAQKGRKRMSCTALHCTVQSNPIEI